MISDNLTMTTKCSKAQRQKAQRQKVRQKEGFHIRQKVFTLKKERKKERKKVLFLGNLLAYKSSIFQNNQMIRMISLKANENKTHKSLK
jgi:hypothetical protein